MLSVGSFTLNMLTSLVHLSKNILTVALLFSFSFHPEKKFERFEVLAEEENFCLAILSIAVSFHCFYLIKPERRVRFSFLSKEKDRVFQCYQLQKCSSVITYKDARVQIYGKHITD